MEGCVGAAAAAAARQVRQRIAKRPPLCTTRGDALSPGPPFARSAAARGEGARPHVVLDLSRVDFANLPGAALLRAAAARGVQLTGCSPLLSSLIESSAQ